MGKDAGEEEQRLHGVRGSKGPRRNRVRWKIRKHWCLGMPVSARLLLQAQAQPQPGTLLSIGTGGERGCWLSAQSGCLLGMSPALGWEAEMQRMCLRSSTFTIKAGHFIFAMLRV